MRSADGLLLHITPINPASIRPVEVARPPVHGQTSGIVEAVLHHNLHFGTVCMRSADGLLLHITPINPPINLVIVQSTGLLDPTHWYQHVPTVLNLNTDPLDVVPPSKYEISIWYNT